MKWIENTEHMEGIDASDTMYPTEANMLAAPGMYHVGSRNTTTYGVVISGRARVQQHDGMNPNTFTTELPEGGFFCVPGTLTVELPNVGDANTKVALIGRQGFRGQAVSGMIEQTGRLAYIDGCTDSMLVYPPRMGDPVLNHLHFPERVLQTQHLHPSIRIGVVLRGEGFSWAGSRGLKDDLEGVYAFAGKFGLAWTVSLYKAYQDSLRLDPWPKFCPLDEPREIKFRSHPDDESEGEALVYTREEWDGLFGNIDHLYHLKQGGMFLLDQGERHSFATIAGQTMDIVAYHPDSDWGPTDQNHPMLNRTLIRHGGTG